MSAERSVEIEIPGATTEDVRLWASNVAETSPVTTGTTPFSRAVDIEVTTYPFMGVVLTIMQGERRLLELAVFASVPTEEEIDIMEDHCERKLRAV